MQIYGHNDINNGILKRNTKRTMNQIAFLLEMLPEHKDISILDIGCGDGVHIAGLSEHGYQNLTGLDYDIQQIQKAKNRLATANFIQKDFITHSGTYQFVFSFFGGFGYGWNRDVLQDARHIYNMLADDGIVVLDLINRDFFLYTSPLLRWHFDGEEICTEHAEFFEDRSLLHTRRQYISSKVYPASQQNMQQNQKTFDWIQRCFSPTEIEILLQALGFGILHIYANEQKETPSKSHQRILVVAQKKSSQAISV